MGKVSLRLSYKNALIAKHSIRDRIKNINEMFELNKVSDIDILTSEDKQYLSKERTESEKALKAITAEIDRIKEGWKK